MCQGVPFIPLWARLTGVERPFAYWFVGQARRVGTIRVILDRDNHTSDRPNCSAYLVLSISGRRLAFERLLSAEKLVPKERQRFKFQR
jgi:hypothetical protein